MKTYIFALATLFAFATNTLTHANKNKPWGNEEFGANPLEDGMDKNGNSVDLTNYVIVKK